MSGAAGARLPCFGCASRRAAHESASTSTDARPRDVVPAGRRLCRARRAWEAATEPHRAKLLTSARAVYSIFSLFANTTTRRFKARRRRRCAKWVHARSFVHRRCFQFPSSRGAADGRVVILGVLASRSLLVPLRTGQPARCALQPGGADGRAWLRERGTRHTGARRHARRCRRVCCCCCVRFLPLPPQLAPAAGRPPHIHRGRSAHAPPLASAPASAGPSVSSQIRCLHILELAEEPPLQA